MLPPLAIDSGAPVDSLARASPCGRRRSLPDTIEDGSIEAADGWGVRFGGWGWGCTLFDYDNDADLDFAMVLQPTTLFLDHFHFPRRFESHTIPHVCVMYYSTHGHLGADWCLRSDVMPD